MDEKKKVAMVLGSLRLGGAERMMVNLANSLSKKTDLTLIILNDGDDLLGEVGDAVRKVFLNSKRTSSAFFPLRKLLREEHFDVLISTQIHVNIFCMAVKIFSGLPVKIILREATTPGTHFSMNTGMKIRMNRKLLKWFYPKADAVVANAEAARRDLIDNGFAKEKKVKLIYNPVLTDTFRKMVPEKTVHPFFGKAPVFISVGRIVKAKNLSLLIEAFEKVLEQKDARLIVIGAGDERKNLERLAASLNLQSKIDFTGKLMNPFPLVRQSDVFVLSSDYEGSPNALIEAMACGIQLVSTDSPGGAAEVLENGRLGKLVPVRDKNALADAMLNALENKIPQENLKRSAERFDSEKIAAEYLSLIEQLCSQP